jgi:hypothetical protein
MDSLDGVDRRAERGEERIVARQSGPARQPQLVPVEDSWPPFARCADGHQWMKCERKRFDHCV